MLPYPIQVAKAFGCPIFGTPYDANWVVLRNLKAPQDSFDGLSTLNWTEPGGAWQSVQIIAATRPGSKYLRSPMNPNGTAMVRAGRHALSHCLGTHGKNKTDALVQIPGTLIVLRDNDRDFVWDPADTKGWTDATGVNHHECSDPAYLAGCVGSPRAQLAVFLAAFRSLQLKRTQPKMSLTVIEV